jgi:hypothetical protein
MWIQIMKISCSLLVIACLLWSCSLPAQMREMNEDAEKTKAAIEAEFGGEVGLSWNITNGKITRIAVVFTKLPTGQSGITSEMKSRIQEIVEANFRRPVPKISVSM